MSEIFWAVFDEEQKRSTEEILATFEKDSKDELGLMGVTIALSNLMFPGTSVLHTRLKYVLLVGWIFRKAFNSKKDFNEALHVYEKQLRGKLQAARKLGRKKDYYGLLGSTKLIKNEEQGDELSQPPFSIYFNLLKSWKIIKQEYESISISSLKDYMLEEKYKDIVTSDSFILDNFELNYIEKEYIYEKIPNSFLKTYLRGSYKDNNRFIDFDGHIENATQDRQMKLAQNFSILMWGCMIYYNYYLGNTSDTLIKAFRDWKKLTRNILKIGYDPKSTLELINDVMLNKTLHNQRTVFINQWFLFVENNIGDLNLGTNIKIENKTIKEFLTAREISLKGDKSRLKQLDLKKINSITDAQFGLRPIEYRWSNIKRFKKDFNNVIAD